MQFRRSGVRTGPRGTLASRRLAVGLAVKRRSLCRKEPLLVLLSAVILLVRRRAVAWLLVECVRLPLPPPSTDVKGVPVGISRSRTLPKHQCACRQEPSCICLTLCRRLVATNSKQKAQPTEHLGKSLGRCRFPQGRQLAAGARTWVIPAASRSPSIVWRRGYDSASRRRLENPRRGTLTICGF